MLLNHQTEGASATEPGSAALAWMGWSSWPIEGKGVEDTLRSMTAGREGDEKATLR